MENRRIIKNDSKIITSQELKASLEINGLLKVPKIYSGFEKLDEYVDGFELGELYIISGPTKAGKSLFAQSLTKQFAESSEYSLWLSYEMPPHQLLQRFHGDIFFYVPDKIVAYSPEWAIDTIKKAKEEAGVRIVFIDHLHYLFSLISDHASLDIGHIVRKLKTLAIDEKMLIFLICHIRKNDGEKLTYQSLRDSSLIAQESDCVLMVIRRNDNGNGVIKIEFHRRTGVINKMIKIKKIDGYLVEDADLPEELQR